METFSTATVSVPGEPNVTPSRRIPRSTSSPSSLADRLAAGAGQVGVFGLGRGPEAELVEVRRSRVKMGFVEGEPEGWRSEIVPIRTLDPFDEDWSDLDPIAPMLRGARVIAVGESTHYAREFHLVKHRLLRFLVREVGVTAFAMESGYPEGCAVARWLRGGAEDLDVLLKTGFTNDFGNSAEMRDQLVWMRANGVRFYGIDVPGTGWSAEAAIAEIERWNPTVGQRVRSGLGGFVPALGVPLEPHRRAELHEVLEKLTAADSATASDEAVGEEIARVAEGLLAYVDLAGQPGQFDRRRDEALADNASWVAAREQRFLLSAANAHVQKVEYATAFGPLSVLGHRLSALLQDEYFAIGTTFSRGSIRDMGSTRPVEHAVDNLLGSAGSQHFAVPTTALPDAPVTRSMREYLDVTPVDVRAAFDVLIHVDEFGPTTRPS